MPKRQRQNKFKTATIQPSADGTCRSILPPGCIELATGDELHFDANKPVAWLRGGK